MTDFWEDADIISVYTRAQAIDDGVLVDVSELAREAGFTIPVALTTAAWADLVAWSHGGWQDETGRLWDVLNVLRFEAKKGPPRDEIHSLVYRIPNRKDARKATLAPWWAKCGPGDDGAPVITVMLEGED